MTCTHFCIKCLKDGEPVYDFNRGAFWCEACRSKTLWVPKR